MKELFRAAGQECWMDFDHVPQEAGRGQVQQVRERLQEIRAEIG